MKRIWLLGLVLVLVMGPSSVAWARPVSTFEVALRVDLDDGWNGWMGYLMLAAEENGIADVDLSFSRTDPCPNGVSGFVFESITYDGEVGFGTLAVERKLASLRFSVPLAATHTLIDTCAGSTTITATGVTLMVDTVAGGDLQRGRNGDARVLSRLSQVTIVAGPVTGTKVGLVSEVISRG